MKQFIKMLFAFVLMFALVGSGYSAPSDNANTCVTFVKSLDVGIDQPVTAEVSQDVSLYSYQTFSLLFQRAGKKLIVTAYGNLGDAGYDIRRHVFYSYPCNIKKILYDYKPKHTTNSLQFAGYNKGFGNGSGGVGLLCPVNVQSF
jgi:hypothetical protein